MYCYLRFSYRLKNYEIVSHMLFIVHSVNVNESLSSFSRISAFLVWLGGLFLVFLFSGAFFLVNLFGVFWGKRESG